MKKLPHIIPVVFYDGARKWAHPLNFASYFVGNNELKAYIPDFQLVMLNLQTLDMENLQGGILVQTAMKAFKYVLTELSPHLVEIFKNLENLPVDPKSKAFISQLFEHIIHAGGDAKAEELEEALRFVESDISREVYTVSYTHLTLPTN